MRSGFWYGVGKVFSLLSFYVGFVMLFAVALDLLLRSLPVNHQVLTAPTLAELLVVGLLLLISGSTTLEWEPSGTLGTEWDLEDGTNYEVMCQCIRAGSLYAVLRYKLHYTAVALEGRDEPLPYEFVYRRTPGPRVIHSYDRP